MNILRYILESSACLIVSYCTFRIIFRNDTRFSQQRLFLIATLLLSLVLPAARFSIDMPWSDEPKSFLTIPAQNAGFAMTEYSGRDEIQQVTSYTDILLYIYVGVMSALLLTTFVQIIRVALVIRSCKKEQYKNFIICRGDKISNAYSFLWWIFIPNNITDNEESKSIITHESVHSSQLHTIDNLILGIVSSIMWFNPVIWLFRRSLHLVHEYLADQGTLDSGIEKLKYQMFLINQVSEEKLVTVRSSFNNKLLKNRMIMMTKITNRRNGSLRILNLLSVSTLMFMVVAFINGFFPNEIKGQKSTATATSSQEVKKDNSKDDKKDLKEETVTGYQKSGDEKKDLKEVTVTGYGYSTGITVKSKSGGDIIISKNGNSDLEAITVVGYSAQDKKIPISDTINYILDGVSVKSIADINPDSIGSVNVIKQDRLVIVRTKSYEKKIQKLNKPSGTIIISDKSTVPVNVLYIVDGKEVKKDDIQNINPNDIESISVLKDKEKVKQYSTEDHDGVIIITTKKR